MNNRRVFFLILVPALALVLTGFSLACGGEDEEAETGTPAADARDNLQVSVDKVNEMVAAAADGDLNAANAAFEAAHDPLHEVIEALEPVNADLSKDLDEAVEDAEKDLEEGEEAGHIAEIGNEIGDLLQQAAAELSR